MADTANQSSQVRIILFDDREFPACAGGHDPVDLTPLDDLRASFEIRTGAMTTLERFAREWTPGIAACFVPDYLAEVVRERLARSGDAPISVNCLPEVESSGDGRYLCVNGRWCNPAVRFGLGEGQALVEKASGHVVALLADGEDSLEFRTSGRLPEHIEQVEFEGRLLISRPWEILAQMPDLLVTDLMRIEPDPDRSRETLPAGVTVIGADHLVIARSANVYPNVVIDLENGPVVIDEQAVVRPGATIIGPAYIGRGSTILDRALIKANTVIGPVCKVNGEVGGTIFQGYANKAHDGHLGDSFVGEWVNFGAGATNSNLLNTYGEVKVQQRCTGLTMRTGMRYLGAMIGAHVKLAIGTRLMTGSVLGTGAMISTSSPPQTCVPPFTWLTDRQGAQTYRFDKFLETARTVMERRHIDLTQATEEALRFLFNASTGSQGGQS